MNSTMTDYQQPVCRLCLKREPDMEDMLMISNLKMIDKIYECTTVLIQESDTDFPTTLCSVCLDSVKNMYDFRQDSIQNQTFFMKIKVELELEDSKSAANVKSEEIYLPDNELNSDSDDVVKKHRPRRRGNKRKSKSKNLENDSIKEKTEIKSPESKNQRRRVQSSKRKNNPIPSMIACEICGAMVKRYRMEGHTNAHTGARPYTCEAENCDKSYYDKIRLKIHTMDHHTGITHECDICGKPFAILSSLRSHKLFHVAPQYNACTFCGKEFRKKTRLRDHVRTHTGERPYQCKECGKGFTHNSKLTVHKRSHTGEKPYKCEYCAQSYGYLYMLKKHNDKCHPKIDSD